MHGGAGLLKNKGVTSYSLVNIDRQLFEKAKEQQLIEDGQLAMIYAYLDNPREAMRSFLKSHPEFLANALSSDVKTQQRAKLCIEKDFYGLS
jgi:hypothetical protein